MHISALTYLCITVYSNAAAAMKKDEKTKATTSTIQLVF